MTTQLVQTTDGTKIAYDRQGTGPALVLLHGLTQSRQSWHQAGYVDRLKSDFTVITLDLRGHGESDSFIVPEAYTIEKVCEDVQTVTAACGLTAYAVWGYSLGAALALRLAARTETVTQALLGGCFFGSTFSPETLAMTIAHFEAVLQAEKANQETSPKITRIQIGLAWLRATAEWPVIYPADLRCQARVYAGSANEITANKLCEQQATWPNTNVEYQIFEGLDHAQEFDQIETIFPYAEAFLKRLSNSPTKLVD